MQDSDSLLSLLFGAAVLAVFAGVAWLILRGFERLAQNALQRCYCDLPEEAAEIPVELCFITYHGLLAWFTQVSHHRQLSPEAARVLLGRLLRFNLTWGMLTPGVFLMLPLCIWSYIQQRRWIAAQIQGGLNRGKPGRQQSPQPAVPVLPPESAQVSIEVDDPSLELSPGRRRFRRITGRVIAGLAVVFAVSAVAGVIQGEYEAAAGGILIGWLMWKTAQDWRTPE